MAGSITQAVAKMVSVQPSEPAGASRVLQNSILTELPGAAFALITLAYVVVSLVTL